VHLLDLRAPQPVLHGALSELPVGHDGARDAGVEPQIRACLGVGHHRHERRAGLRVRFDAVVHVLWLAGRAARVAEHLDRYVLHHGMDRHDDIGLAVQDLLTGTRLHKESDRSHQLPSTVLAAVIDSTPHPWVFHEELVRARELADRPGAVVSKHVLHPHVKVAHAWVEGFETVFDRRRGSSMPTSRRAGHY